MVKTHVPRHGDIISLNFDPQSGHEQGGYRPALVVSSSTFNKKTNLTMVCPITTRDNGFIFHIPLAKKQKTHGFVLIEHLKSLDVLSRDIKYIEKCDKTTLGDIQYLIKVAFSFS
jgi:mRNA interferase MazF